MEFGLYIPRSRPLTNCSSRAGSTFAVFFLFSYFLCAFFDRCLLIRASSSADFTTSTLIRQINNHNTFQPVYKSIQEAQLPQRDRTTPRTHFTRDRQTDGQKAVARARYAVCTARKKGLRPKKPTENIGGQRSYTVGDNRMQVFYLYNGKTQQSETIF